MRGEKGSSAARYVEPRLASVHATARRTEDERLLNRSLPAEPAAIGGAWGVHSYAIPGGSCVSRASLCMGSMLWPRSAPRWPSSARLDSAELIRFMRLRDGWASCLPRLALP